VDDSACRSFAVKESTPQDGGSAAALADVTPIENASHARRRRHRVPPAADAYTRASSTGSG
jgi:hypothetical protein